MLTQCLLLVTVADASIKGNMCVLGRAGLGDRVYIYSKLANIAQQTGGTVYIPPRPCDAFDYRTHGGTGKPDCMRQWKDYLDLPYNVKPYRRGIKCVRLTNMQAYRLKVAKSAKRLVVKAVCSDPQREPTVAPYVYYHIRRGDLLWAQYKQFDNAKRTSISNVIKTFAQDHHAHKNASFVWSTDETSKLWINAFQSKFNAAYPSVGMQRADALFPGCKTDDYCIYCNVWKIAYKAVLTRKFGTH
jgi:hypothetical protein